MHALRIFLISAFLFGAVIIVGFIGHALASDCGCSAEPDGGWGAPDYTNDPSWGSSLDDLMDDSSSSNDAVDTGGSTGGSGDGSSTDSSGSSSTDSGSGSSSSDSGSSSAAPSGGSSDDGVVWRMKGDSFFEQGLYNESLAAYEKAATYDPYARKTWTSMARVSLQLGDPGTAVTAYTKAIKLDPSDADLYVMLGDAYTANGSYPDAITAYQKALVMNPKIAGVADRIILAEAYETSVNITDNSSPEISALPAATDVNETELVNETEPANETATVPILPEATPSAALPGTVAGISALIAGLVVLARRR